MADTLFGGSLELRHGRAPGGLTVKRRLAFLGIAIVAVAGLAGAARATPGSGGSSMVMARADFQDAVDVKIKIVTETGEEVIHVADAQQTVVQRTVLAPGGHTGWHSHPGPAMVLVTAGALTLYSADDPSCAGRTYSAGQAFIDRGQGHVHIGRNLGDTNTELWTTFLDVVPQSSPRIDAADPGTCSF